MKKLAVVFVSVLMTSFAIAQTVDEIVDNHIKALGGRKKLEKIDNVVMKGMLTVQGADARFEVRRIHNTMVRQDSYARDINDYEVTTRTKGWFFLPSQGMQKPYQKTTEEIKDNQDDLDARGLLYDYAAKGYKVTLLDRDTVGNEACYKLLVTLTDNKVETVYISQRSYMIVRIEAKVKINGKIIDNTTDFSNYKKVAGVKMPFTFTQLQATRVDPKSKKDTRKFVEVGKVVFQSIEVNQPIDEKLYKNEELP